MEELSELFEQSLFLLSLTDTAFVRYLYDNIDWNNRLIGIKGARGIGKTTLLLQRMKKALDSQNTLYVTCDHFYFSNHRLYDLAETFAKQGGKYLFIDEIHKYKEWSKELKMIYDLRPDLNVVFTGSSVLDIDKGEQADLSRRAIMYNMQGLSFREYLSMFHGIDIPVITLDDVLATKANDIVKLEHPLQLFYQYLYSGYYPFSKERDFRIRLMQIVEKTIENDIPYYAKLNVSTARKLKHLLMIVSQSAPFKPNYQSIAQMLDTTRLLLKDYMYYMEKAGLIGQLRDDTGGVRALGKVEKIYIDNPSLCYLLANEKPETGNLRETFFYNQLRQVSNVRASKISDFEIDGRVFEVGGRNKGQKQLQNAEEGYIVKADIEFAHGNNIPLWHFGFLY
ncbi:MAG: AAA family ATPase [Bacteroidales bacterium]|nr:AAA family ATPase [Bacteroidales bacterium]